MKNAHQINKTKQIILTGDLRENLKAKEIQRFYPKENLPCVLIHYHFKQCVSITFHYDLLSPEPRAAAVAGSSWKGLIIICASGPLFPARFSSFTPARPMF